MESTFTKRQSIDPGDGYAWEVSNTGMIIRYAIAGVICLTLITFILGGYLHAQHRLRKGLEPLPYHRWLVSNGTRIRNGRAPVYPNGYGGLPRYPNGTAYQGEQFNMNNWNYAPPPPAYNVPHNPPPEYYYVPPSGPPPSKEAKSTANQAPAEGEDSQVPQPGPAHGVPPQAPGPAYAAGVYR